MGKVDSVFIDVLIVNTLFNYPEYDYDVFWKLEIIYLAKCNFELI